MTFIETREKLDKMLDEAAVLKAGPTPEKINESIPGMREILARLIELRDPKNEIQQRVCGNREIYISNLETEVTKSKVKKAIKAAVKKAKKAVSE